jgi:hypothetical protein
MPLRPSERLPFRIGVPFLLSLSPGCATSLESHDSSPSSSLSYLILNGLPDYKNRYPSVVQILGATAPAAEFLSSLGSY